MKAAGSLAALIALAATVAATPYPAQAEIAVSYLYKLCNFQGVVRIGSPKLSLDPFRRELYVITAEGVSVYNSSGMEIYQTDFDPERGLLYDLAVDEKGHIFTLSTLNSKMQINECNYRLEPRRRIELHNLPPQFSGFNPDTMRFQDNRLYFANSLSMKIVVTDRDGAFVKGYDLVAIFTKGIEDGSLAKAKEGLESYTENGLDGFNLDREGNMLFVLPVTGKACRLSPDGILTQFGKRGSGHGKFGIPSAIVADKAGNYYVTDKLRTMVIVFDKNLKFVKEFNYLGGRADSFAAPCVMAMSDDGKLYVGQVPKRGVLVYRVVNEE